MRKNFYMKPDKSQTIHHTYATADAQSNNSVSKEMITKITNKNGSDKNRSVGEEYAHLYETPIDGIEQSEPFVLMKADTVTDYQKPIDCITDEITGIDPEKPSVNYYSTPIDGISKQAALNKTTKQCS